MTSYPQLNLKQVKGPKVTLNTTMGDITIQLFPEEAPKTVENFVGLVKNGYYEDTIFHRVISEFMIQGGDPTGTGMGGESIWNDQFEDEFSDQLFNLRGALSMANAGPNTNGSQFFIVQASKMTEDVIEQLKSAGYPEEVVDAYRNGGTPWLDFRHTVFGQVIEGMDVVDKIAMVKKDSSDKPMEDVVIRTASVDEG